MTEHDHGDVVFHLTDEEMERKAPGLLQIALHAAAIRVIRAHPDAQTLGDVERSTGRDLADLLTEETGLPGDAVRALTADW